MAGPKFEVTSGNTLSDIPECHPTPDEKSEAAACIDALKYDEVWQGSRTLQKKKTIRLHNFGGGKLEVQLLTLKNPSIAQVLVQPKIKDSFSTPEGREFHDQIRKTVVEALKRSLARRNSQSVAAKLPAAEAPQFTITSSKISPFPKGDHPSTSEKEDALKCVNALTYDKIFKKEGEISKQNAVRLDSQKATTDFRNLQIQINGIGRPSTIAQVLVDTAFNEKFNTTEGQKFHEHVKNVVANTLKKSVDDHNSYKILLKTWTHPPVDPPFHHGKTTHLPRGADPLAPART